MKKDEWWLQPLNTTAADVDKEIVVNIIKWVGWKLLLVIALIVVL